MEETWSVGGRGQGSAGIQALGYLEGGGCVQCLVLLSLLS